MARSLLTGAFLHADDAVEESTDAARLVTEAAQGGRETGRPNAASVPLAAGFDVANSPDSGHLSDSFTSSESALSRLGTSSAVSGRKAAGRKPSYWQCVASIGRQVADALGYAHQQGILHRDVKPSNLLLDLRGTVWVTDFGLAKVAGPGADNLTHTGDILGTLRYMPPEAFEGRSDARSDVYSLGLTLYELLAMRPAFDEKERNKLIKQVTSGEPIPLDRVRREIPRDLVTIVQKAIEKEPSRRYATAEELAADLQRFIDDEPILARRQTELERCVRWARHNPWITALGAILTAVLVLVTIASLIVAGRMAQSAADERLARLQAVEAKKTAESSFAKARKAEMEATAQRNRADHEAEAARQNLYEAQMLRAPLLWRGGHQSLLHLRELLDTWLPQGESLDRRGWEWFYLNSLPYQNQRTLTESGKSPRASTVAWHVASKRLAEGTSDGLIRIWDVDREQTTLILRAPAPGLAYWGGRWLAWSPDGRKLAAGGHNGTVHLWDTGSGRELAVLSGRDSWALPWPSAPTARAWRPGDSAGTISIWDANTGRTIANVVHPGGVGAGAWSPDDQLLATGHFDGTVTISGIQAGDQIVTLRGTFASITDMAWSPDGIRLAAASSYDFSIRIWEVASKRMVLGPLVHSHEAQSVAWEPNGQRLASGSIDETIEIWDATTGRESIALRGNARTITSLAWGPEGVLASGSDDGNVRVWSPIHDQESSVLPGHVGRAHSVSWSPEGRRLASGGDDGKVRIWDPHTRKEVLTLEAHDQGRIHGQFGLIRSLAWSPDGKRLASAGLDGTLKVWEIADGGRIVARFTDGGPVWAVAWSPNGTRLAAGYDDGTIRLVEGLGRIPKVHSFQTRNGRVRTLAWSPHGERLASGAPSGIVSIWDPIGEAELVRMRADQSIVMRVAWSPDGKRLASCGANLLVITWDAATGRKLVTMHDHHSWVDAVAWSPDGTRLASAGLDNSVRISDPQTGRETCVLRGHSGMFHDVSWHLDGARLAAASSDGQIWIWDATRGYERDRTPRALPYIDRAIASGAARGEDLRWFAESYLQLGKPREALALVKDDPSALRTMAPRLVAAYHDIGDQRASDEVVKRYPEAAAAIGDRYAAEKDWDRAIAEYSKVITDRTADGNVLVKRAVAYEATGQRDLAAADWQRAARSTR